MGNIDTVKQMYEAFGRGDIPAIIDKLDPNVEWDVEVPTPGLFIRRIMTHKQYVKRAWKS